MMRLFDTTVCLLLTCSLAANAFSVSAPARVHGDLNGDGLVDVLDVQALMRLVAEGAAHSAATDLNNDGHTDILDLQQLLSEAAQATARNPQVPLAPSALPAPMAPHSKPPARTTSTLLALPLFPDAPTPAPDYRREDQARPLPRCERYLFTLMPNAPPTGFVVCEPVTKPI